MSTLWTELARLIALEEGPTVRAPSVWTAGAGFSEAALNSLGCGANLLLVHALGKADDFKEVT